MSNGLWTEKDFTIVCAAYPNECLVAMARTKTHDRGTAVSVLVDGVRIIRERIRHLPGQLEADRV